MKSCRGVEIETYSWWGFENDFHQAAAEFLSECGVWGRHWICIRARPRINSSLNDTVCVRLPLVVRTTGLLVVFMKVLMAERKPTSTSNMTSTCGSRQFAKGSSQTKLGSRVVSYPLNYTSQRLSLPNGLPLQTEWVMWLSFCSVPLFDQRLVRGCPVSWSLVFQTGHRGVSDLLWPSS